MRATHSQYARALLEAYEESKGKERRPVVARFLTRLRRERRSSWFPAIVRTLERLRHLERVSVRSACTLKPALRSKLEEGIGLPITHLKIEPSILAGVILEINDLRLNTSLMGKVVALRKKLCHT